MTDEVTKEVIVEPRRGPRTEPRGAPTLRGKKEWTAQEVRRGSKECRKRGKPRKGDVLQPREEGTSNRREWPTARSAAAV